MGRPSLYSPSQLIPPSCFDPTLLTAPETSMVEMGRALASAWPVPFAQDMTKDRGGM